VNQLFQIDIHPAARFGEVGRLHYYISDSEKRRVRTVAMMVYETLIKVIFLLRKCVWQGVFIDHGTGVVIGETAVVGHNVSMLHMVTLGGSGKKHVDRHPKIGKVVEPSNFILFPCSVEHGIVCVVGYCGHSKLRMCAADSGPDLALVPNQIPNCNISFVPSGNGVLLGAGATVLGNVRVGDGSLVGACSLVLEDIPPASVAVGVPAKVVGHTADILVPAQSMQHTVFLSDAGEDIEYVI